MVSFYTIVQLQNAIEKLHDDIKQIKKSQETLMKDHDKLFEMLIAVGKQAGCARAMIEEHG